MLTDTTVEILKKARALVESGWTQNYYAKDARGNKADIWGTIFPPVAFCMEGAIFRVTDDDRLPALRLLGAVTGVGGLLTGWNDRPGRTQAEVLAAFDRAIELAGEANDRS